MTEKKKKEKIVLDEKTAKVFAHKHYTVKELLGEGAYGKVYKAQRDKDGIYAAVKVIDPEIMPPLEREKFVSRELESLMKIKHPYVLEIFDIFKSNKKFYIFMEFSPNGDLSDVVQKGAIAIPQAKKWFRQITEALAFMHDKMNIVHRDIKLENVLLSVNLDAKLADFGMTRVQVGSTLCGTICGTTPYYSPELTARSAYDAKASDVWAMGCLLFAMTVARLPFGDWPGKYKPATQVDWQNFHKDQMARAYKKREGYSKLPADVRDLIEKCMEPNVKKRITAAQMLQHKALK